MNKNINNGHIFNEASMMSVKALSPEELIRYKEIGEELYGKIDFESSEILNNLPASMTESVAYISELVKSGLHPSMLEENEKELMKTSYGEDWFKKYGYVKEDLDDIVTLKR